MSLRPAYALVSGAGKDATLALHRARAKGLNVTRSLTMVDASDGRVRFHGVGTGLVRAQAEALGLDPTIVRVARAAVEPELVGSLERLAAEGLTGVVFGNIHLADVRAWYEERTRAAGLEHVEPLWGEDPERIAAEVVDLGYRALVTCVEIASADSAWLGRELDHDLLAEMRARSVDPCGERGEYHTFVFDGPGFAAPASWCAPEPPVDRAGFLVLELDAEPLLPPSTA